MKVPSTMFTDKTAAEEQCCQPSDNALMPGLSEREAAKRLQIEGFNDLPTSKPRSTFRIGLETMREPMFLLLAAAGGIYLLIGDLRDALVLMVAIFVVIGITIYQERKTERALEALRDLSSPRALVIRDGVQKRIAGRDVVRDDLIVLAEGDRVAADAVVLSSMNLSADESLLTGESVSVRKATWDGLSKPTHPGGDDLPFVYSGTLIVTGQGIARVSAVGNHTEIGKIGKALSSVTPERTQVQKETGRLIRIFGVLALALSVLGAVAYALTRGDWLNGLLVGITMAISLTPEEFAVVLTVFLALGAWRISKEKVLTRRIPAVETLGSSTVLCVDKTGTLTLNRMSVAKIYSAGVLHEIGVAPECSVPASARTLIEYGVLASKQDPFDPTEIAFQECGTRFLGKAKPLAKDWSLLQEYPLSPKLLALSQVWRSPNVDAATIAAKGAPEAIADLCRLDQEARALLLERANEMAADGLRVLGVARASFIGDNLPTNQRDFEFRLIGLVGLADPVRPLVARAIRECYNAGVRVVMITGDYPVTAQSIARQIGLNSWQNVLTGAELRTMNDDELRRRVGVTNIFARMVPEQKLRLVQALKANGEIVAMTGDGVNDAPAIKAAHIGIAMGGRGTDVAREAADLVLLNDDFTSIEQAVRLGRRIFDNLKKAMTYVLSVHVPLTGMALVPALFNWPLILMPLHITFMELIIDPACSLAFEAEPEEANVMKRPPRDPRSRLFNGQTILVSLLQGIGVFLMVLVVFLTALYRGQGELDARALTFTTMIVANVALIWTNRSWTLTIPQTLRSRNKVVWALTGGAMVILAAVLYVPVLRDLFRFSTLHFVDLALCFTAGVASILWFEILKLYRQRQSAMKEAFQ